jgi:hypothetical protein
MAIKGILPITTDEIFVDSLSGGIAEPLRGFGTRLNIGIGAAGEDIWAGTATQLPIPPDVGEQMTVVSTSANDTLAGTGIQIVQLHYIDANGISLKEDINMAGLGTVNTAATNIRFVQELHAIQVGSGGVAAGNIIIYKFGAAATIYTQIPANTNMSLNTARMVPAGKVLLLQSWTATGGGKDKEADIRLRITSDHGVVRPRVFIFHDNIMAFSSGVNVPYVNPIIIPAFAILKCTAYTTTVNATVQASWEGVLLPKPI